MAGEQPVTDATNTGSRRRSSGFMPAFESLHQQKRSGEANAARRQSMSEQAPKGGIFHNLFHSTLGKNAGK
ncbi:hypothetical protein NLU13_1962 [Sarocladium strictum]|uniref:Uncharacterized protein n=1 Tax=Sarocladium strictum TaxID=5046 RepID=A0AA39GRZ1_SARSR|nr:hypothetical protein NLU13_1962 [Sarocladium strictum]